MIECSLRLFSSYLILQLVVENIIQLPNDSGEGTLLKSWHQRYMTCSRAIFWLKISVVFRLACSRASHLSNNDCNIIELSSCSWLQKRKPCQAFHQVNNRKEQKAFLLVMPVNFIPKNFFHQGTSNPC